MTNEDLKAMRADLTAAIGPMAAANVFFAWAEAIAARMEREAREQVCVNKSADAGAKR